MKSKIISAGLSLAMFASVFTALPQKGFAEDSASLIFSDDFESIFTGGTAYGSPINYGNKWEPNGVGTVLSYDEELGRYKVLETANNGYTMGIIKAYGKKNGELVYKDVTGHIRLSTKFKPKNAQDVAYLPIAATGNTSGNNQYTTMATLQFNEGKIRAAVPDVSMITDTSSKDSCAVIWNNIADYTVDTWYDVTVDMYVGGDSTTTADDYYYYSVSDGENTYTGGPYYLGLVVGNNGTNPCYDFTALSRICFGYTYCQDTQCEMTDIKAYQYAPEFTASIKDGATGVETDNTEYTITFDQMMDASTFSAITFEGGTENYGITPASGMSKTAKITVDSELQTGTKYTITVPGTVKNTTGAAVKSGTVNFTTKKPVDPSVIMSDEFETLYNDGSVLYGNKYTYNGSLGSSELAKDGENYYLKFSSNDKCDTSGNSLSLKRTEVLDLSGKIEITASVKYDDTTSAVFVPIPIIVDGRNNQYQEVQTIMVRDGNFTVLNVNEPESVDSTENYTASYDTICEAEAGKWYDIKLILDIDGDSSTFDRFSYEVSTGKKTYTGKDYIFGAVMANNSGHPKWNFEKVTGVWFNEIRGANVTSYIKNIKVLQNPALCETSIANGEQKAAVDEPITVTFDQTMDASTFKNITLMKNGKKTAPISVAPETGRARQCIITLDEELEYNTDYVLTIPNTVLSTTASKFGGKTVSFSTVSAATSPTTLFTDDFDKIYGWAAAYDYYLGYGNFWGTTNLSKAKAAYDDGLGMYKAEVKSNTNPNPAGLNYKNKGTALNAAGNIAVSAKIKLSAANKEVKAIVFDTDGGAQPSPYGYIETLIFDADGTIKAVYPDGVTDVTSKAQFSKKYDVLGNYEANKWYDIKMIVNCDGDAATFDTYSVSVSDGTNTYSGGPYVFGTSYATNDNWPDWAFTKIDSIGFGYTYAADYPWELANVKAASIPSALFESSILDGESDVAVDGSIRLKFDQLMRADTFTNITLQNEAGENIPVSVSPYTGKSKTVTVTPAENLAFNRLYRLTVPTTVTNLDGIGAKKTVITFTTEAVPDVLAVANIEVNDGYDVILTEGSTVKVSADFTNRAVAGVESQDAVLLAGIYNPDDEMIAVCYTTETILKGSTKTLKATFTVPKNVEKGAYVKVFCWDTLKDMTPIGEAVVVSK